MVLAGVIAAAPPSPSDADDATPGAGLANPIEHVVVIIEENHTFDSYFGRYPGADGYDQVTSWPRVDDGGDPVPPFLATSDALQQYEVPEGLEPLSNGTVAASVAYDGGAMDGFVYAQQRRGFPGDLALATNDRTTAEVTWRLADDYVLFDRYFSSTRGGSLPNQLHLFTGSDHGLTEGTKQALGTLRFQSPPTMFDQLAKVGVDWGFYSGQLDSVDREAVLDGRYVHDPDQFTPAALYWAPFLALPRFWTDYKDHFRGQRAFYEDAAKGSLPPVSVVLPEPTDHPVNIGSGQERLQSLINGIIKGPEWSSTAVFVVWDDWGGFFDHVPPPGRLGFRVPMLLVSPWARQGYIASEVHDHTSVLRWILDRFGAPQLPTDSTTSANFDEAFDFSSGPRPRNLVQTEAVVPPTPVGSGQQNTITLGLYVAVLAGAATVACIGLVWRRRCALRRLGSSSAPTTA